MSKNDLGFLGLVSAVVVVSLLVFILPACTINPPSGVDAKVDSPFFDAELSAPKSEAAVEAMEKSLAACIAPYSHSDTNEARALQCDCARNRNLTTTHWYTQFCNTTREVEEPAEEAASADPDKPTEELVRNVVREEGYVPGGYNVDGVQHGGFGRNRAVRDIDIANLTEDVQEAIAGAKKVLGAAVYDGLFHVRQNAVANLVYNLGEAGYAGFEDHVKWMKQGKFHWAADELLDSKAAEQLPSRMQKRANEIREG